LGKILGKFSEKFWENFRKNGGFVLKNVIEFNDKNVAKRYWFSHLANVENVELSSSLANNLKLTEVLRPRDSKTFSITYETNSMIYTCPFILGRKSCEGCEYLNEHIVKEYENGNVKTAMVCDREPDSCSAAEVFEMMWKEREKIKSGEVKLVIMER
jgi:hypothetical protein